MADKKKKTPPPFGYGLYKKAVGMRGGGLTTLRITPEAYGQNPQKAWADLFAKPGPVVKHYEEKGREMRRPRRPK